MKYDVIFACTCLTKIQWKIRGIFKPILVCRVTYRTISILWIFILCNFIFLVIRQKSLGFFILVYCFEERPGGLHEYNILRSFPQVFNKWSSMLCIVRIKARRGHHWKGKQNIIKKKEKLKKLIVTNFLNIQKENTFSYKKNDKL